MNTQDLKWYRVYEGVSDDSTKKRLLSHVDTGPDTNVLTYVKVIINSPKAASTGSDFDKSYPRWWMSVYGVLREFSSRDGKKVAIITGK